MKNRKFTYLNKIKKDTQSVSIRTMERKIFDIEITFKR